ncbi:GNAT family N-acetyltransferase [Nocardioides mangrovi]|uniref:GNAT family N-acetyltransferase n=1 Tax=Nocardioides mangrovi TaxID=2874580 RepID=UPI001CC6FCB3|nr:N-acetyltransferase [Nocardioides mangrovi]
MKSSIRPATPADSAAIAGVVADAFGDKGPVVARLVTALEDAGHARAGLVAEVEGQVVGHTMLSRSWVDAERALVEVLVLSPMSVATSHHGQGIGTDLLAAAVVEAERLGTPAVFLEGDPRFYGPRGWSPGRPLGFAPPSTRIPDPGFQVVVFAAREDWMTGALVYCDPFWSHDCVGLR